MLAVAKARQVETGPDRQPVLQRNAGRAASATQAKGPWRRLGIRKERHDCPQIPWAMRGPDRNHPAILLRAGEPLIQAGAPAKPGERAVR